MRHVFVETNWLVGYLAPEPYQVPAASELLERARLGELVLHLPAVSLIEARKVIANSDRFKPKGVTNAMRQFLAWGKESGAVTSADREATLRVLDQFESRTRKAHEELDTRLGEVRQLLNVDVFALDDRMLELSIQLVEWGLSLNPFDQAVLAGVLGRAEQLREQGQTDLCFCVLDSDLQPWYPKGEGHKQPLKRLYDERTIWVYGDFDLQTPAPPADWPSK